MSDNDDKYRPISCADYDAYEIAIMHRERLRVTWHGDDGLEHIDTLSPRNLETREHEEYLIATSSQGGELRLRLDRILKAERL